MPLFNEKETGSSVNVTPIANNLDDSACYARVPRKTREFCLPQSAQSGCACCIAARIDCLSAAEQRKEPATGFSADTVSIS